jgi:glycosyltransferase involved in cell wall biosynthesis/SAM-dependent methyltransferase
MLNFTGERIVPEAENCEPLFALKMYQEHIARYLFAAQACQGKRVLDVGCGVGYGSNLLARLGAATVTAFDISEDAVRHAREHYAHPKAQFFVASTEEAAFSRRFDVIACFELIEHVNRQSRTLERLAEALEDDGLLIMSTPRPTGRKRSAFHTRELSFVEFSNLLHTYFTHVHLFFENNHFASLVTSSPPDLIECVHALHPQFSVGQADYFIAVASRSPLDVSRFRPQLVLNNDDYVRNLEQDVQILHGAEADLRARIAAILEENSSIRELLQAEKERASAEAVALARELQEARRVATAAADAANADRGRFRAEIEAIQSEKSALSAALEESRRRTAELEAWHGSVRNEAVMWRQRAAEQIALVDALRREVDAIYSSGSWRVTAPLRRVLDVGLAARRWLRNGRTSAETLMPPPSEPATMIPASVPARTGSFRGRTTFDVVYVIGCHEGESKRYRAHNVAEALRELGYETVAIGDGDIVELIASGMSVRVVVLFRSGDTPAARALISWCAKSKIALVYDVDDLVFELESIDLIRVVGTFSELERAQYVGGVEQYRKMLQAAVLVTCPTAFLASRIELLGKRAEVIPNSLNRHQIEIANRIIAEPKAEGGAVRISYFSGSNTHQTDFRACEGALLSLFERYPRCRLVVGGILDLSTPWERYMDRVDRLPFMPYDEMLAALAGMDINIAPLEMGNAYCEGKSQLKIFEAGLVQVPTVASATSSYREAIENGTDGFLASNEAEWLQALDRLVLDRELRRRTGARARARALRQFGPEVTAKAAVRAYGLPAVADALVAADSQQSDHHPEAGPTLKISWLVPGLIIGGGGHRNILRAAYHLSRFGHNIELYFTNTDLTEQQVAEAVRTHFYPLDCPIHVYHGKITPADVLFATHWSTVDAAVRAKSEIGELMYFVQDFEPAFAPMGTEYVLAENTYRMGLYHITSGPWCEHVLKSQFKADADHFIFPIDTSVYRPRPRVKPETNIVFFAKPEMPRRCFELGLMALEEVHRLRPEVEIILFGSRHVEGKDLPFRATLRLLLPSIEDLAVLYANADTGVVFSTTNPSLVPYEMMACGLPVVDLGRPGNEINYAGRSDIALLADPAPATMARQIIDLLDNPQELAMRSRNGTAFVKTFPSEEQMARRVETLILSRLAAVGYGRVAATGGADERESR